MALYDDRRKPRIGATNRAKNGLMMTIVGWRNRRDIDIQFEDGVIVYHKQYKSFLSGMVKHPDYCVGRRDDRVGLTGYANNGMKITITKYITAQDIDVMCEDGTPILHQTWDKFRLGRIFYPGTSRNYKIKQKHNGNSHLMDNGIILTVVSYNNSRSIVVRCDTGYETTLHHSKSIYGNIKHPFPYQIGIVSMDKPAYIYNGVGNFYCHCTKCGLEDIMTVQEMREHICQQ